MKRIGHLCDLIFTEENLRGAVKDACRNKRRTRRVLKARADPGRLVKQVLSDPHPRGDYEEGFVTDVSSGKTRHILKPSMHDQVVHHAIIRVIAPYLEKGSYRYSCGAVKGKGPLYASNAILARIRRKDRKSKWYIKLDIVKYYESIDRRTLKRQLRRKFKDKRLIALLDEIIDCVPGERGIPIGNLTSQYFANFHLQDFDHWVKESLLAPFYLRYMDDMLLIGPNKRKLVRTAEAMAERLEAMGFRIHRERMLPRRIGGKDRDGEPTGTPLDMCGFRHYKKGIRTMRKRLWKRLRRALLRAKSFLTLSRARTLASRYGWHKHSVHKGIDADYSAKSIFGQAFALMSAQQRKEATSCQSI